MSVEYWTAQYIPDVFRNEPRNIGVLVKRGENLVLKFFGEGSESQIDHRKLRSFTYPDVYKQWVEYWRRMAEENNQEFLEGGETGNYRLTYAGHLTDTGDDALSDIVNYLYSLLISAGGLDEAISGEAKEGEETTIILAKEVATELQNITLADDENNLIIKYPIRTNLSIMGNSQIQYNPAFSQRNGKLAIIEVVDFSLPQKIRSCDHAGWVAYMLKDIGAAENSDNFAVVKYKEEDRELETVDTALKVLENEADIIHWENTFEKQQFLDDREAIALDKITEPR